MKGVKGEKLTAKDIADAQKWGKKFNVPNLSSFIKLLKKEDSSERREKIKDYSAIFS